MLDRRRAGQETLAGGYQGQMEGEEAQAWRRRDNMVENISRNHVFVITVNGSATLSV
jgi:hypothetical protein